MSELPITNSSGRKYRLIMKPVRGEAYEFRFIAQRKTIFGWININWSYLREDADEYIDRYHKRHFTKRKALPPVEVLREVEL